MTILKTSQQHDYVDTSTHKLIAHVAYPLMGAFIVCVDILANPEIASINQPQLWILLVLGGTLAGVGWTRLAEVAYVIIYMATSFLPITDDLGFPGVGIYLICVLWISRGLILPALATLLIVQITFLATAQNPTSQIVSSIVVVVIIAAIGTTLRILNKRLEVSRKMLDEANKSTNLIRSQLAAQLHDTVAKDFAQIAVTARNIALNHPDLQAELDPLVQMAQSGSRRVRPMILNLDSFSTKPSFDEAIAMSQKMLTTRSISLIVAADANLDRRLPHYAIQLSSLFIREAATNALKYAPGQSNVYLFVELGHDVLSLTMRNEIAKLDGVLTDFTGGVWTGQFAAAHRN